MAHTMPQSARVRDLWANFEVALLKAQRTTQHRTLAAHAAADQSIARLPVESRPTPAQHEENKDAQAHELQMAHYQRVSKDWNARLAEAGLTLEMWTDMTPEEMSTVATALGIEASELARRTISSAPRTSPSAPVYAQALQAPSLTPSARGYNISTASWRSTTSSASNASYALVKPSEIYSEEEEEDTYFSSRKPIAHSEPASPATSYYSGPASASDNDEEYGDDEPGTGRRDPFASWSPVAETSSHTRPAWNSHSRHSTLTSAYPNPGSSSASAAASIGSLPSGAPHGTHNEHMLHAHSHGQRTASSSSASSAQSNEYGDPRHSQSRASSNSHSRSSSQVAPRVPQPYIGPSLLTADEGDASAPSNAHALSEADAEAAASFDRFKLTTRMRMIVEFHAAAAAAEIKLAGEIWRLRRGLPPSATVTNGDREKGKSKAISGKDDDATPRKGVTKNGPVKKSNIKRGFFEEDEQGDANSGEKSSDEGEGEDPSTPAGLVLIHQRAMTALQAAKEAERREVVLAERNRRRAEMDASRLPAAEKAKDGGKREKEKERRKGRSGTLISGQPAASPSPAPAPVPQVHGKEDEPWLSAAWNRALADNDEGSAALTNALGAHFNLDSILSNVDGAQGVEGFINNVLPSQPISSHGQPSRSSHAQWSPPSQQTQPHQAGPGPAQGHTGWGSQQTPTAMSFGAPAPPPAHRRRASTSASASASAAAAASTVAPTQSRRVHAPIPVRAAPFGDTSASSSDEDGGFAQKWGSASQAYAPPPPQQQQQQHHQPQAPAPRYANAQGPPLQALERELDPDLMAAFVQYSGLGGGGAASSAGPIPLGGANSSSSSTGSYTSGLGASQNGGYGGYGAYGSSNMYANGGANNAMYGAPTNNNPYAAAAAAFDTVDQDGMHRGGGPHAFALAAEGLSGLAGNGHVRGYSDRDTPQWPGTERPPMHTRGVSAHANGHAAAPTRSRSRSPTMTRALPSLAARMAGHSNTAQDQQQSVLQQQQQQQQYLPQQMSFKEHPARGPSATPVASGWTRKQKPTASTGTPQPQAPAGGSAMHALKNVFGFSDDGEHVNASTPAPVTSSWLGGKAKKAAAAVVGHTSPTLPMGSGSMFNAREVQQEPDVSLWEQVTQQRAKATPPAPSPFPATAESPVLGAAGKKPVKKVQRQTLLKKGGRGIFGDDPEDPEPEAEPTYPSAYNQGKFAAQALVDEDADDANAMFGAPARSHGSLPLSAADRRRLDSYSAPGGWDAEAGSVSTPRPAPAVPHNWQDITPSLGTPPAFGLKPVFGGAAPSQYTRPASGLGMNSSTIRARAAPTAEAPKGGAASGRSLWGGLFGGGSGEAAQKQQEDQWASQGAHTADGPGGGEEAGGNNGGGDDDGYDDWTSISKGSSPVQAPPAPPSKAAAAPSPAITKAVPSALAKKGNAKKGAKGKKVMIEDVPDEETDNRGDTLPVDSRHIFDDAGALGAVEKPTAAVNGKETVSPPPNDDWMEAAAKEIREAAAKQEAMAKQEKPVASAGGAWGAGASAAKTTALEKEPEPVEEPSSPPAAEGDGAAVAQAPVKEVPKGKGGKPLSKAAQKRLNKGK